MTSSLTGSQRQSVTHTTLIDAPARAVYDVIADVTRWPYTFGPTVHSQVLETDGRAERIRLWAFANGDVRTWVSQRILDPGELTVRFSQATPSDPVESMSGEWRMTAVSADTTRVDLLHEFRTATGAAMELVSRAVDTNSKAELAALKQTAELGVEQDGLVLSFVDKEIILASKEKVYDFLYRADLWPTRLAHVFRVDLDEAVPNVQSLEMDTRSPDGAVHTTHSVRICFTDNAIAYKQTSFPKIMAAHTGQWSLRELDGAVEAASRHTVVIRPDQVTAVLGPEGTVDRARELIRRSLGTNSLNTLRHAKQTLER